MMPAMGIGSALTSIVGQNLGADNIKRAKEAFKTSIVLSIGIMLLGGIILINIAEGTIRIFTDVSEVVSQSTYYLKLLAAALPLMGIFQVLIGLFQGSGHTVYSMIISMGRLWAIRIPMILIFKNFTDWGSQGVWYAMVSSNFIICCIGFGFYLMGNWQEKVIHDKVLEN